MSFEHDDFGGFSVKMSGGIFWRGAYVQWALFPDICRGALFHLRNIQEEISGHNCPKMNVEITMQDYKSLHVANVT